MSQSIQKPVRQLSLTSTIRKKNQSINNQHRHSLSAIKTDSRNRRLATSFSIPVLLDTMDEFFQATRNMEDEIMLPTKLKDISVDEIISENSVQVENWHEVYTFVRGMRNQLQCMCPFAEDVNDNNTDLNNKQRQHSNDDEGIIVSISDNSQFSSASSIGSYDESENSSTSSGTASHEAIKNELKYHYYGLFQSLNNLTSMANRVTDKYREESGF
ncbi:unnamed protein product [Adineta steineri]|uniref:Uncharacterized protein n=1 Tax=Adineta steineri TaxID=433720 RepID=A0A815GFB1_9BILA|nr:unnamed protein product [Adineta steineri]CAF3500641.1 unnamed protein product [Adineta steineri]